MTALREGRQLAPAIGPLLDCVSASDEWINAIAATGDLPGNAASRAHDLAGALRAALDRREPPGPTVPPDWLVALRSRDQAGVARSGLRDSPNPDCFFIGDDPLALVRAVPELVSLRVTSRVGWELEGFDPFSCNLVIEALSAAPADAVRNVFRLVPDQAVVVPLQGASGQPAGGDAGPTPGNEPDPARRDRPGRRAGRSGRRAVRGEEPALTSGLRSGGRCPKPRPRAGGQPGRHRASGRGHASCA